MHFLVYFVKDKKVAVLPKEDINLGDKKNFSFSEWKTVVGEVIVPAFYDGDVFDVSVIMALHENDYVDTACLQNIIDQKKLLAKKVIKYCGTRAKAGRLRGKPVQQVSTCKSGATDSDGNALFFFTLFPL